MNEIVDLLNQGNYSCVIKNNDRVKTFTNRGVKDLYDLINSDKSFLDGALVADKVIGKGAAMLMALGNVKEVSTNLISEQALKVLNNFNIKVVSNKIVPFIINRTGDGWCPLEIKLMDIECPDKAFVIIDDFINTIIIIKP